jgi:vitamin B12 transporter
MSARHPSFLLFSAVMALSVPATIAASQSLPQLLVIRVLDPAGNPIENARVIASTRDSRWRSSATTTRDGTVRFDALAAAAYVIEVSAEGFETTARLVALDSAPTAIDFRLPIAGIAEQIIVTASGDQQAASEVSKAVSVVDRAEVDARQEFSVADAVRSVPGISVQQLGGPGAFASIKLRGMREQDTAVLIDGVRFRDAGSPQGDATAFVGELFVTDIDRIEVLRGSGSSLYGSHAVGGAINVITREGHGSPAGEVAFDAGSFGFVRGAAHAGGSFLNERVRYSGGAIHVRTSGLDPDDDARDTSVQARGDVRLSRSANVTFRTYGSDGKSAINESPAAIGPLPSAGFVVATPHVTFVPSVNDPDSTRDSTFVSTLFRLQHRPAPRFGYTTSFHRLTTSRTFVDGPEGTSAFEPRGATQSAFEGLVSTFEAKFDLDWSSRHVTTAGYEFERERYVSRSRPVNPSMGWRADITQDSHAAWLQQQLRFEAVQLAGGVRMQSFSMQRPEFDPGERAPFSAATFTTPPAAVTGDFSASSWIERAKTKVRAHVGNAYRSPAMFERAGASFGSRGYTVYGDPQLEPERSLAFDVGVDQMFADGRIQAAVTWFHTRLTRVIAFESLDSSTDPFGRAFGYRTADGRATTGIELGARVNPHADLHLNVSYTFVDADPPVGNRDGLPRAAAIPAHQFSAFIVQRIARDLQLSFELEAAGDHYVTLFDPVSFGSRAYGFDGIVKADVAAIFWLTLKQRTRLQLHGTVENVFDRLQFVQGFRTPGRTARAGATVTF